MELARPNPTEWPCWDGLRQLCAMQQQGTGGLLVCVGEGGGGLRSLSPGIKVRPPGAAASQKPFIVITKTAVTLA